MTGCRWPLWPDGARPTQQFCDAAREPDCSYCAPHKRLSEPLSRRDALRAIEFAANRDGGLLRAFGGNLVGGE